MSLNRLDTPLWWLLLALVAAAAGAHCGSETTTGATAGPGGSSSKASSTSAAQGSGAASTSSSSAGGAGGAGGSGGQNVILPWTKHFGSPGRDYVFGLDTNVANDLALQVLFTDTIDFGSGPITPECGAPHYSTALVKLDANGNLAWARNFTNSAYASPSWVRFDPSGNLIFGGSFNGPIDFGGKTLSYSCTCSGMCPGAGTCTGGGPQDIYLAKVDSAGQHLWSHSYGDCGGVQAANAGSIDQQGNIYVAGRFTGQIDFGLGPLVDPDGANSDVLLAKLDPSGNGLWSKEYGDGQANAEAGGIALDSSGNVILTGDFISAIDFGGGPLAAFGDNWSDVFLAKLDTNGKHIWSKRFGAEGVQSGGQVATDGADNIILSGQMEGSIDFGGGPLKGSPNLGANEWTPFLAKFDKTGKHLWSKVFPTTAQAGVGVAASFSGMILTQGYFNGSISVDGINLMSAGSHDMVLAAFDPTGKVQWAQRFGGPAAEVGALAVFDGAGNATISGVFNGSITLDGVFGSDAYQTMGDLDLFIGKFKP